jgi:putative transposase
MRPKREPVRNNQQTYMVTSETWGRRSLFRVDRWAELFVEILEHYRGSAYQLHAFVVMPDHFHVLITPAGALEKAVQFIKGGFSHRAKVELGSSMEVWQKGFSDHRIRDLSDFENHVKYIHENPVRAGLCATSADYPYSSASGAFPVDDVPQRLKPLAQAAAYGAAEAAPLQTIDESESAEAAPLQRETSSECAEAAPLESNDLVGSRK